MTREQAIARALIGSWAPRTAQRSALNERARREGRDVLEEVLARYPEWTVDSDAARLYESSTVRGWETLPIVVG